MSDPTGAVTTDALSAAPDLGPAEAPATSPAPSDTQSAPESTSTPDAPDWEALKSHPDVIKRIEEEAERKADALAQKRMAKQARQSVVQRADQALADDDPDSAMQTLREARSLLIDPEDGASIPADAKIAALGDAFFDTPEYRAAYVADKPALDKLFQTGTPDQIKAWVDNHATERKSAEDKRIATVAAALVEQEINKRLGSLAQTPTGTALNVQDDDAFMARYSASQANSPEDHARARRLLSNLK